MVDKQIVALIVTFNPDERLLKSIRSLKNIVSHIVIVDNHSSNVDFLHMSENEVINSMLTVLELNENFGIAYALNYGIKYILDNLCPDYILTLDQDTIILVKNWDLIYDVERRWSNVGIISLGEIEKNDKERFELAKYVITSGNLVRSEIFKQVRFRDEFFIDQVDFDFDFNVRKAGYSIVLARGNLLDHRLGLESKNKTWTYEPPIRVYYIIRNSTVLLLERKFPISLYLYQISYWFTGLILNRGILSSIKVFFQGIKDGLLKNLGKRELKGL